MNLHKEVKEAILKALPHAHVTIKDPFLDGLHLEAHVKDPSFKRLSLLSQHKKVMLALKALFDSGKLHALTLKTRT